MKYLRDWHVTGNKIQLLGLKRALMYSSTTSTVIKAELDTN